MLDKLRVVLWFTVFALVIVFIVQNVQPVEVKFLAWEFSMSRAILITLLVAIGFVGGWLTAQFRAWKKPATPPNP